MVRFLMRFFSCSIDTYEVVSGESIGVQNFSTDALRCAPTAVRNAKSALFARMVLLRR